MVLFGFDILLGWKHQYPEKNVHLNRFIWTQTTYSFFTSFTGHDLNQLLYITFFLFNVFNGFSGNEAKQICYCKIIKLG